MICFFTWEFFKMQASPGTFIGEQSSRFVHFFDNVTKARNLMTDKTSRHGDLLEIGVRSKAGLGEGQG